jgi:hypothetical protein
MTRGQFRCLCPSARLSFAITSPVSLQEMYLTNTCSSKAGMSSSSRISASLSSLTFLQSRWMNLVLTSRVDRPELNSNPQHFQHHWISLINSGYGTKRERKRRHKKTSEKTEHTVREKQAIRAFHRMRSKTMAIHEPHSLRVDSWNPSVAQLFGFVLLIFIICWSSFWFKFRLTFRFWFWCRCWSGS